MKNPTKKGRRPPVKSRTPVIAVRVPFELHQQIKTAANRSGATMSETMAALLRSSFEWQAAFTEVKAMKVELVRLEDGALRVEMRRRGWTPLHGSPYWLPPGAVPTSRFIEREVDELEQRINALKAARAGKGRRSPE